MYPCIVPDGIGTKRGVLQLTGMVRVLSQRLRCLPFLLRPVQSPMGDSHDGTGQDDAGTGNVHGAVIRRRDEDRDHVDQALRHL